MESYGVSEGAEGLLAWSWAEERLVAAHNYWVAASGPVATPVWGLWRDGAFVFSTGGRSRKARALARDPHVVVHLESGDEVVIVEGVAERIEPAAELLADYGAKYGVFGSDGLWFAVRPQRALAWQEATFPTSTTRFDF